MYLRTSGYSAVVVVVAARTPVNVAVAALVPAPTAVVVKKSGQNYNSL